LLRGQILRKDWMTKRKMRKNESIDHIAETSFFSAGTADDVYHFFIFSAAGEVSGNLSYKISYEIVEMKSELLSENLSSEELAYKADGIHYYVRKAAHMTEYFLLAIAISFPLYVYGVRGIWLMLLAGIVCVGFAGLDEYHQSFVGGRTPAIKDVGIDSSGAFIGILLVQAFCWSVLNNPNKKKKKRK
jgi:VanZ family protein